MYRSAYWPTKWLPNPYYWPGNEHNLFSVWLFPFAGRPDLTQKYSRQIVDTAYGVDGAGLPGNDDYATMSAWLVWACLGFYPVPSTENYVIGSPYISYARIDRRISLDTFAPFRIRVNGNSKTSVYVKKIELNGKLTHNITLSHFEFGDRDVLLEFWMSSSKRKDNLPSAQ
jgi:putative alpha-1,2-mannosidase